MFWSGGAGLAECVVVDELGELVGCASGSPFVHAASPAASTTAATRRPACGMNADTNRTFLQRMLPRPIRTVTLSREETQPSRHQFPGPGCAGRASGRCLCRPDP